MAKRFSDTKIWTEDWFLEMPNEYKLFWFYMLAECDHAGLFKVNLRSFRGLLEVNLSATEALKYFNNGKDRIRVVSESIWYIEDFIVFQYGTTLNLNNRLHDSIKKQLEKHGISLTSIRGVLDLKHGVKEKDKVIGISVKPDENGKLKNGSGVNFKAQGENVLAVRVARNQSNASDGD